MGINFKEQVKKFRTNASGWDAVEKVNSHVQFHDGRRYTISLPDADFPNSYLVYFDFGKESLIRESITSPKIGAIKVDLHTDDDGQIIGLNPARTETGSDTNYYNGVLVQIAFMNMELQVRYKVDPEEFGTVTYDGIYRMTGYEYEQQDKVKNLLNLPERVDILGTIMKLLEEPGDADSLQENPFVLPGSAVGM